MKNLTDEELMNRVSKDELDFMKEIFDRYHLRIYNFIFQMSKDPVLSQDLTQNVFYKIMKSRKTYNGNKVTPWIYTIARNNFKDHYRNKVTYQELDYRIGNQIHTDNDYVNQEGIQAINHSLDQLNPNEKELILLNKIQGIKYDDLAIILNGSSGAIKTKIHRTLKKLRTIHFKKEVI